MDRWRSGYSEAIDGGCLGYEKRRRGRLRYSVSPRRCTPDSTPAVQQEKGARAFFPPDRVRPGAPQRHQGAAEGDPGAIKTWNLVLLKCFDGLISLTAVSSRQAADI
jgi:hypothetical protein